MTLGETHLETLIKTMQPVLHDEIFVFCTSPLPFAQLVNLAPLMMFKEEEGTALILDQSTADHAGLSYDFISRMITLNVHSSLNAVGFLAVITKHLAAAGISVNPVSAHFHDHLFIPREKAEEAMRILQNLSSTEYLDELLAEQRFA